MVCDLDLIEMTAALGVSVLPFAWHPQGLASSLAFLCADPSHQGSSYGAKRGSEAGPALLPSLLGISSIPANE